MERVTCRTIGSILFEVGANTDDDDDGAVETEASWSPTGQWYILRYSVTRVVIY